MKLKPHVYMMPTLLSGMAILALGLCSPITGRAQTRTTQPDTGYSEPVSGRSSGGEAPATTVQGDTNSPNRQSPAPHPPATGPQTSMPNAGGDTGIGNSASSVPGNTQ